MNSVVLCGRITKTPELRTTKNNKEVCEFCLAVNRFGEGTDFITCLVYGTQAANLCKYQGKGSQIAVNGSLRVDSWDDEKGQRKYKTYVLCSNIEFLGTKKEENAQNNQNIGQNYNPYEDMEQLFKTDDVGLDLPF